MGYIKHHAIIITTWDDKTLAKIYKHLVPIFGKRISKIIKSDINGFVSLFIAPDGSKEDWPESDKGDKDRAKLIRYLNTFAYEDGSNAIKYVEISYDEEREAQIVNNN